ncbi:TetR/AcrR family transcriptional regulator [Brevibacillus ruminantium]|uniref:TetR/AcrR family transcriptional regulator n=1 Tax=Brevibacillus ruminantium TaxID=2950604 RepID=A0ABY4W8Q1_9BACL|nr:TetR/AcrR family transcriptional regulator [Brevibacillus ruminantium]USG63294.1 TetR/AcrR family transcriptional regulator [Brevibacillus ruminantium]
MKQRIQQAVLELIVEKGVKFTMSDLASHLGTSKRTIYEHFASKEEMISVIVDEAIAEVQETERKIYEDQTLTTLEKLKAVLCIVPSGLHFGDARLLSEMKRYVPDEWKKIDKQMQEEWKTVTVILEQGIANGELRPLPVTSVIQMLRGASAAIYDPDFLIHSPESLTSALDTMVEVLLNGMAVSDCTKK